MRGHEKMVPAQKENMKESATVRLDSIGIPDPKQYQFDKDGITQGLAADFATCRQRFLFRINGWRSDEEESEPLFFGSLCHEILEKFYTTKSKRFALLIPGLVREYAKEHGWEDEEVPQLKAIALLTVYTEVYAKDKANIVPIRTEEVFRTPGFGTMLRGRKDLVFEFLKSRKKWMMEHKTKGRIDHEFLGYQLSHDIQNHFYDLHEITEHTIPFTGILYNILRTPQLRPKKKETGPEFLARLFQEIREQSNDYFFRYEVTFTKQDRTRFASELKLKVDEMKLYLQGKLAHYRNEAACQTPFRCRYLKACTSGLMTGYTKHKIIFPELED